MLAKGCPPLSMNVEAVERPISSRCSLSEWRDKGRARFNRSTAALSGFLRASAKDSLEIGSAVAAMAHYRHSRERGNPASFEQGRWIPGSAAGPRNDRDLMADCTRWPPTASENPIVTAPTHQYQSSSD